MLEPIRDGDALATLAARVDLVVTSSTELADTWLARGRVAAPEASAGHFDDDMCFRLAHAFEHLGVEDLVAGATEPLTAGPFGYRLEATRADLASFSRECGSLNFMLLPRDDDSAAVLCSTDDVIVVAGPPSFVRYYTGPVVVAEREFAAYVDDMVEFEPSTEAVLRRAHRYFETLRPGADALPDV